MGPIGTIDGTIGGTPHITAAAAAAMGIYECAVCSHKMMGESYGCLTCGYALGDGNIYCEDCADKSKCDVCGERCCVGCGEQQPCCGRVLCGSGNTGNCDTAEEMRGQYGVVRDACVWKHAEVENWAACGHPRCALDGEPQATCFTCAQQAAAELEVARVKADRERVRALLESPETSASLKAALTAWLGPPAAAARGRDFPWEDSRRTKYSRTKYSRRPALDEPVPKDILTFSGARRARRRARRRGSRHRDRP